MSHGTGHISFSSSSFSDKVEKLVGGGSAINEATLTSSYSENKYFLMSQVKQYTKLHTLYIIQHKRLTSYMLSEVLITPFDSIYTYVDRVRSNVKKGNYTK